MDITPYLKLMVDKKADSLIFSLSSAPRLRLLEQEKPVGNTILNHEMLNDIFQALTEDTQKLQFSIDKKIRFVSPLFGSQDFIIDAIETDNELSITISIDKRQAAIKNTPPLKAYKC
ncbi:hypothetical protein BAZMOX_00594_7 [methanotrophic endosymbiont of Bathymodiolus azoricus (Menez Gwen)]|jgi:twitching motility protein PilU|nr:hypothetical protein BAZMOX_00594_7 [methanotrophic endosymbiont of Bathymodiolus azoricus (Menez Gwen)]